jgi:tRNA (adenine22-N1)-methyltransferase
MQPLQTNNAPALDARLAAAAAFVRPGAVAADIGCDHGKLAVWLALQGRCPKVIACDLRPHPLAKARALAQQCGCAQQVDCRLGDGLAPLCAGEADDVIIAGVSGVTICEILAASPFPFSTAMRFVLVPATKHAYLRRWLWQHGFALLAETPICAAGRYYTVMHAAYTGQVYAPTPMECAVGLAAHGACGAGYLQDVAHKLDKCALGAQGQERQDLQALAQAVRRKAEQC